MPKYILIWLKTWNKLQKTFIKVKWWKMLTKQMFKRRLKYDCKTFVTSQHLIEYEEFAEEE